MPRSYSLDLRNRVHAFVEAGHSRRAAARHFDVSPSFVINLLTHRARHGTLSAKPQGGARRDKLSAYRSFLIEQVEARPDIALEELVRTLHERFSVRVHLVSVSRLLRKAGYTYKKTLPAQESERADVRAARTLWRCYRQPAMARAPHRLVFIDEISVNTKMVRACGRSLSGQRLKATAPFGHWSEARIAPNTDLHRRFAARWLDGSMDCRRSNEPSDVRMLCRNATGANAVQGRRRDHGQSRLAQEPASRSADRRPRRLAVQRFRFTPAALQPRPEPCMDGSCVARAL